MKRYTSIEQVEQELFPARYAARQRSCPACGAGPGEPCIAAREQMPLQGLHRQRIDAQRVERTVSGSLRGRGQEHPDTALSNREEGKLNA